MVALLAAKHSIHRHKLRREETDLKAKTERNNSNSTLYSIRYTHSLNPLSSLNLSHNNSISLLSCALNFRPCLGISTFPKQKEKKRHENCTENLNNSKINSRANSQRLREFSSLQILCPYIYPFTPIFS